MTIAHLFSFNPPLTHTACRVVHIGRGDVLPLVTWTCQLTRKGKRGKNCVPLSTKAGLAKESRIQEIGCVAVGQNHQRRQQEKRQWKDIKARKTENGAGEKPPTRVEGGVFNLLPS